MADIVDLNDHKPDIYLWTCRDCGSRMFSLRSDHTIECGFCERPVSKMTGFWRLPPHPAEAVAEPANNLHQFPGKET